MKTIFSEKALKNLGFARHEWNDEELGVVVDHKFENENLTIEITNLKTVELTTKGQYISLDKVDNSHKLKQLINLLS